MPSDSYTQKIIDFIKNKPEPMMHSDIENAINQFAYTNEQSKLQKGLLPLGKYKYKSIEQVLAFDREYLEWLVIQPFMEKPKNIPLKETIVLALVDDEEASKK